MLQFYLVQVVVEIVAVLRCGAVDVVPPVAGEHLLVENRSVGAEKTILPPVKVAIVIHLQM